MKLTLPGQSGGETEADGTTLLVDVEESVVVVVDEIESVELARLEVDEANVVVVEVDEAETEVELDADEAGSSNAASLLVDRGALDEVDAVVVEVVDTTVWLSEGSYL